MKNITHYDIGVFENEDYFICFGRTTEPDGVVKELHLYRVQLALPEIYVLASDPEGAISQATCVEHPINDRADNATAERVPFSLRGWGGNQF